MHSAREFGIRVVRTAGDEEYCLCPFHSDHSPSASFNRVKGLLYCYVCGRGWNLVQLEGLLGVEVTPKDDREPEDYDLLGSEEIFDLGEDKYVPYFEKRGIQPIIIMGYGVRWKQEPEAAVLPIRTLRWKLTGVAYRYLVGDTRYKVFGKTTPVWPMHLLSSLSLRRKIVVTEGAWSAMRIASVLGSEVLPLALLGAKASPAIVDVLRPFCTVFLYDGDPAGERACRKMRTLFPSAHAWTVPVSPDDMQDKEIVELFDKLESRGAL